MVAVEKERRKEVVVEFFSTINILQRRRGSFVGLQLSNVNLPMQKKRKREKIT